MSNFKSNLITMDFSIFDYIAYNEPQQAVDLLQQWGYTPLTMTENDIASGLMLMVQDYGDSALKAVYGIHPDKEAILEYFSQSNSAPTAITASNLSSTPTGNTSGVGQQIHNLVDSLVHGHTATLQPSSTTSPVAKNNDDNYAYGTMEQGGWSKQEIKTGLIVLSAAIVIGALIVSK